MMYFAVFALLAINVVDIHAAGKGYGQDWDYIVNSANGPAHWGTNKNYPICGNNENSPINILSKDVIMNEDLKLTLHDYAQKGGNFTFVMQNRQTDIAFLGKSRADGVNLPQSVTFEGTKYRFYQFHFHWGTENHKGSEHLVDSQRAAAELHLIHQNTKYKTINDALNQTDGLLVWGHFLKVNSKDKIDNTDFEDLLKQFSKVANDNGSKTVDVDLNLYNLLPREHHQFFTYKGGLTTPPCYESVRWIVNRQPILVSEKQMKIFRTVQDKVKGTEIRDNFRPPQNLGTRKVSANFDPADLYRSSGMITMPCLLTILTFAAALFFNY